MAVNALQSIETSYELEILERVETTRESTEQLMRRTDDPLVQGPLLTSSLMRDRAKYEISQDADDMEELRAMAFRVLDHHNRVTKEVAEAGNGRAIYATELKSEKRMKEKFGEHGSTHRKMGDVLRTSIVFDDLESLYESVIDLYESVEIVRVKDRFVDPRGSGYRDLLFNVRLEDPETGKDHITEIQFQLAAMDEAKEKEHPIYKERRTLEQELKALIEEDPANLMKIRPLKEKIVELEKKSKRKFADAWAPYQGSLKRYNEYKQALESRGMVAA